MDNLEKPKPLPPGESYVHLNNKRTTAMSDFELYYSRNGKQVAPRKFCDKYTLLHVVTMTLAGVAFLTLGVVAGYFIADGSKYSIMFNRILSHSSPE